MGWAPDDHMRTERCLEALHRALAVRQPDAGRVHRSDRGAQNPSCAYVAALDRAGLVQRLRRTEHAWDNAVAESPFGALEQELGTTVRGRSVAHARADVRAWIHGFHDHRRPHATVGFHSPVAFAALHRASITEAT